MCRRYQILRRGSRIQGLLQLQYALLTFFTLTRNQTLPSHPDASLPGRITPETRWLTTLRCVNSEVPSRRSQDTSDRPPPPPHTQTHTLSLSPRKHSNGTLLLSTQAWPSSPVLCYSSWRVSTLVAQQDHVCCFLSLQIPRSKDESA